MKRNLLALLICQLFSYNILIGQPTVTTIPGTGNLAYGISPSGKFVTGTAGSGCFIYNVDSATIQNFTGEEAWSVNDLGIVVGNYLDPNYQYLGVSFPIAGLYNHGSWTSPGLIPGFTPFSNTEYSYAYGISDDSKTICGMVWRTAAYTNSFIWNDVTGYTILDDRNQSSKAMCLSGDGKVAGGWVQGNQRLPFYWKPDSVLLDPNGGETHAINIDGSAMVGIASGSAFLWSADSGMHYLATYQGASGANAYGLSDSGLVVGYYSTGQFPPLTKSAFLFIPGQGMLNLRDYLTSLNATNIPPVIDAALGISRDGKTIIAYSSFPFTSYVIHFDTAVTGINVPSQPNDWFYVSPNPVTEGKINIKGNVSDNKTRIQLLDLTGREIFNMPVSELIFGEFQLTLDLNEKAGHKLIPGIYMMNLVSPKKTISRKLNIY